MKQYLVKMVFLSFILSIAHSQDKVVNVSSINIGQEFVIESEHLQDKRSIFVSKPKDYDITTRDFPVILILDGDFFFELISSTSKYLAYSHQMDDSVVVAIPQKHRHQELKGAGVVAFREFIKHEVIPLVSANFRVNSHRILIGHSLGGSFALDTMINDHELFNAYVAISPVVDSEGTPSIKQIGEFLAQQQGQTYLYLSKGNESGHYESTIPQLGEKIKKLSKDKRKLNYKEYPNETHGTVPLVVITDSMRDLYDGWILPEMGDLNSFNSLKDIEKIGGYKRIEEYYKDYSSRMGVEFSIPYIVYSRFAWIYHQEKQHEVLKEFVKEKGGNSESERVNYYLGQAYLYSKDYQHAIELMKVDLDHHPKHALGWYTLGQAYEGNDQIDLAIKAYQKAIAHASPGQSKEVDGIKEKIHKLIQ